jgi:hypothetical protein
MPGEDYQSWSTIAANNGNADTAINWAEGQPRASVNNSSRSQMAAHAKNRNLLNGSIVTGGTASAQTFTSGVSYTVIPTGLQVLLKIGIGLDSVDGTATTLNMDGIGDVNVKNQRDENVEKGLVAGTYAHFIYNGTNWIWLEAEVLTIINNTTNVLITQVIISTTTTGPVALVDFTDIDTTKFAHYHVVCSDIVPEIDHAVLVINLSVDNGASFGSYSNRYNTVQYFQSEQRVTAGGNFVLAGYSTGIGYFPITWAMDAINPQYPHSAQIDLFSFQTDKSPTVTWTTQGYDVDTEFSQFNNGSGFVETMVGANAIRIWPSVGNFVTGKFTLYGSN